MAQIYIAPGDPEGIHFKHFIDYTAPPSDVPKRWEVERHLDEWQFDWVPKRIALYRSEEQMSGDCDKGNDLDRKLQVKSVLNVNVLEYLFENKHLIPKSWEWKRVFFWGTIFRDLDDGLLYVRCLSWESCGWGKFEWRKGCKCLDSEFTSFDHAAMFA